MQQATKPQKDGLCVVDGRSFGKKGVHMARRQFIYDILCSFLHPHRLLLLRKLIYFFLLQYCSFLSFVCCLSVFAKKSSVPAEKSLKLKLCVSRSPPLAR